jgi:hypothetical protein
MDKKLSRKEFCALANRYEEIKRTRKMAEAYKSETTYKTREPKNKFCKVPTW